MNFALTPIVQRLLIINAVVFAATFLLSHTIDLYPWLALNSWYSGHFIPTQFVTHLFMHGDFMHIFSNMIGLIVFGPLLENFLGSKKFLILYLFSGIGAGLLYWGINMYEIHQIREDAMLYLANPNPDDFAHFMNVHASHYYQILLDFIDHFASRPDQPEYINQSKLYVTEVTGAVSLFSMVGASGAIFGILMAFALLFPNTELVLLFPPIPIKAKFLVAGYALWEIYRLVQDRPDDNVAHFAHIAGMGFAFILIRYWNKNRNYFY